MTKNLNFNEIKDIWSKNVDPVMLYIHSPYCKSTCSYCVYRGCKEDEKLDYYYDSHLPEQIDKYMEILESQEIKCIYFGGGTPNIRGVNKLIPTFKKLDHLKCMEKVIELHTGIKITDEDIEILSKFNFNTVILCIQTFNKNILARVNRYTKDINDIDLLIGKFHKVGIKVGIDLIQFNYSMEDSLEIKNDLNFINSFRNKPDEITISPLYQSKCVESDLASYFEILESAITSMPYIIKDFDKYNISNYKLLRCWRLVLPEVSKNFNSDFYSFIPYLSENGSGIETSCIGIGSYKNIDKDTYSYNRDCTYIETFDGEHLEYNLTKEYTFYDKVHSLINWMESVSVKSPPRDLKITISNVTNAHMSTNSVNDKSQMCEFNITSNNDPDYINELNRELDKLNSLEEIISKYMN